jgi:hypothetical protein
MEKKTVVIKFRTTTRNRNKILTRARAFAGGNLSLFIEQQALNAGVAKLLGESAPSTKRVAAIARRKPAARKRA